MFHLHLEYMNKYASFFQSVIITILSIVIIFTSILFVILNSNYWLYFISIFYISGSKYHIIYSFPFIFNFTFLIDLPSHCFTVSLFVSKHNGLVAPSLSLFFFLGCFPSFPNCPWVWPLVRIAAYIQTTFMSDRIVAIYPPWRPASVLVLGSRNDGVDDEWSFIGTTPLPPLFPAGGTTTISATLSAGGPPIKNRPGSIIWQRCAVIIGPKVHLNQNLKLKKLANQKKIPIIP